MTILASMGLTIAILTQIKQTGDYEYQSESDRNKPSSGQGHGQNVAGASPCT